MPHMRNLEVTIVAPEVDDGTNPNEQDVVKRHRDLSGTLSKLLAILCDELEHNCPHLDNIVVHLPCLCGGCDAHGRGTSWSPSDMEWKKALTAQDCMHLLDPLRRLRVSRSIEFRYGCKAPSLAKLQHIQILQELAEVMTGCEPVEPLAGERKIFFDLRQEVLMSGLYGAIAEEFIEAFWDMDDGFEERRPIEAKWFMMWLYRAWNRLTLASDDEEENS